MLQPSAIGRYLRTLRYLKARQVFYQIYYRLRRKIAPVNIPFKPVPAVSRLKFTPSITASTSYVGGHTFRFLNLEKTFEKKIDWNFTAFGKLWAYNLNYFDFLNQASLSKADADQLLQDFYTQRLSLKEATEPYPISLRGINWIKYFANTETGKAEYDALLYQHYHILAKSLEYHLMGNHLLENGLSLLFGAYYFRDQEFYDKAKTVIVAQLEEQITFDGAHFELSPMYHQTILYRMLDVFNLIINNEWKNDDLRQLFAEKISMMLGWLRAITFSNGDVPMVNDSSADIAPTTGMLEAYADRLGFSIQEAVLSDSGYRMIRLRQFELFLDIGKIGPDYIPGHAHSDTLNFLLYVDGNPVIVEAGTSTYDAGRQRSLERSTASHNTVMIDGCEQSEVWASFRVGRRARITNLVETSNSVRATHDGYKSRGKLHARTWNWNDRSIKIIDEVTGSDGGECRAFLHFHHALNIDVQDGVVIADRLKISFENAQSVSVSEYKQALGFNKSITAKMVTVSFSERLESSVLIG